jgi:hypothetical protein
LPGDGKKILGSHPEMLYMAKSLFAKDKSFQCEDGPSEVLQTPDFLGVSEKTLVFGVFCQVLKHSFLNSCFQVWRLFPPQTVG